MRWNEIIFNFNLFWIDDLKSSCFLRRENMLSLAIWSFNSSFSIEIDCVPSFSKTSAMKNSSVSGNLFSSKLTSLRKFEKSPGFVVTMLNSLIVGSLLWMWLIIGDNRSEISRLILYSFPLTIKEYSSNVWRGTFLILAVSSCRIIYYFTHKKINGHSLNNNSFMIKY